jgi:putative tryptophan/tyrosine transport system substrate-binding protein
LITGHNALEMQMARAAVTVRPETWSAMRRREFIGGFGSVALAATMARAQQSRHIPVIGVLWHAGSAEEESEYLSVLVKAFEELGYVEGKTVAFLHKFPAEEPERFLSLARELVESRVDIIVAVTAQGALALKQVESAIPIVFVIEPDPIRDGLVAGLARPGGHMTGLSLLSNDLSGKRLALLKEAVPNLVSVALVVHSKDAGAPRLIAAYVAAAKQLGVSPQTVQIPAGDAIEEAFAALERDRVGGAIVNGSLLFNERARVGAAALAHKVPTLTFIAEMVPYGLLMSYGQDFPDYFRKAAGYVDRILRGANPADLPVEQPTRFKQVVNLKVAKLLGLSLPQSLLVTTDEIIE